MTRRFFLLFGFALLVGLVLFRVADPVPLSAARAAYFDQLQRISPRKAQNLPVLVVDIDEASLREIGQWPWPRDQLAVLVERLWGYGAAAIVFDVLFPEPDRLSPSRIADELVRRGHAPSTMETDAIWSLDNDERFAAAIRGHSVVLGSALISDAEAGNAVPKAGFLEIGEFPSLGVPIVSASTPVLAPLADAAEGLGMISVSPTGDTDVVRTVPLVWSTEQGLMPALSVEALRVALGETTLRLKGSSDISGFSEQLVIGEYVVPTTADGQMWIYYRHDTPDLYVPAHSVMTDMLSPDLAAKIEGAIVFVGTSSAGLLDIRSTALGEAVPGVSIHAQIIEQILTGRFLIRSDVTEAYEIISFLVLGVIVLFTIATMGPIASLVAGGIAGFTVLTVSWVLFKSYGALFDATFSLAAGVVYFTGLTAYQFIVSDRDKRRLRRSFSHYVSPDVLGDIEAKSHEVELGGLVRPITVMFCDIRNFTSMSEKMEPGELVELLNNLFTVLGDAILAEKGTIDKFIGDAIMAFWNAPLETPDHEERALRAALSMRDAVKAFNSTGNHPEVSLAIGISTGSALVGNIGSKDRFNYSAIGDAVNRASRIETACRHVNFDILVSKATNEALPKLALLDAGQLALKGVAERVSTSILVGGAEVAASPDFGLLAEKHAEFAASLARHGRLDDALFADCLKLAERIEPTLVDFYMRIGGRTEDFAHDKDESAG